MHQSTHFVHRQAPLIVLGFGVVRGGLYVLICLGILCSFAQAQVTTATITGNVLDSSGALVPGVEITVTNVETGRIWRATTGPEGIYSVPLLPPGRYQVIGQKDGFRKSVLSDLTLQVAQVSRVNLEMQLGTASEVVDVAGDVPLLQSESAEVGQVIGERQVKELPLNGRYFLQLALLTPGVVENAGGTPAQNITGTQGPQLSINGNRQDANNYTVDGAVAQDPLYNSLSISPVVDAIQEFKVQSSLSSVQWGGQGGGYVNIVTRSGTNGFHGSLWEFLRNDKLNAHNYFDRGNRPVPPYKQNQFGATFGGRIIRGKTFFFASYEGLQVRQSITGRFTVPSVLMRQGDFSEIAADPALAGQIPKDPITGQPFPNNRIPADRFNGATQVIMQKLLPLPTDPGLSGNFLGSPVRVVDSNQFSVRLDHRIGQSDTLFGRLLFMDRTGAEPFQQQQFVAGGGTLPGFGQNLSNYSRNLTIGYTKTLSPTTILDLRFGYNRNTGGQRAQGLGEDYGQLTGIQGLTSDPSEIGPPSFNITGLNLFGPAGSTARESQTFEWRGNWTLLRGRHTLDIGGGFLFHQFNPISLGHRGSFTFNGFLTGNSFADFLLGIPSVGSNTFGENTVATTKSHEYNFYVGDKIKVTPRFSLELGLRYDFRAPWQETEGRQSALMLNPLQIVVAGEDGQFIGQDYLDPQTLANVTSRLPVVGADTVGIPRTIIRADRNNFSPRVGFAWSPFSDKTVIRGGYGLFYSFTPAWVPWLGSVTRVPFVESRTTQNVLPSLRLPIETVLTAAAGPTSFTIFSSVPDYSDPYIQQASLGVQYSPTSSTAFELRWNFNKGTGLYTSQYFNFPTVLGDQATKPIPFLSPGSIFIKNLGFSTYHAMTLRGEKRMSRGLSFGGSWVWSRSIDNDSLMASTTTSNLRQRPDNDDLRGLSSFHISHRLVFNYLWELPFGPGRQFGNTLTGALGKLAEGWFVTGITSFQTGLPFTVNIAQDWCGTGVLNCRPNQLKNGNLPSGEQSITRWFDTSAFALQPRNTYGSANRSVLWGPGLKRWDISLGKETQITESHRIRFQTDFFNAFNTPQFNTPQRIIDSPGFGEIQSANDPRLVQFSLKYSF